MESIGIIITQSHNLYTLCPESDHDRLLTARVSGKMMHRLQRPEEYPAVGDRVTIEWDGKSGNAVIRDVLPRRSCLNRVGDMNTQQSQVIAANLDVLLICMSLNQNFRIRRAERYLAAARAAGVEPIIVLTKTDLCPDSEGMRRQTQEALPGVQVLLSGPQTPEAADAVRAMLAEGKFVAFAGSSGVGKSTLVNAVLDRQAMITSAIREGDGKGRHTTTHRELIFAGCGGAVIDTPGMRAFALDDADVEDVFGGIAELAQGCRFSDCTHRGEPGCAVRMAVAEGRLSARQLESYLRLREEAERRQKRRKDMRAAAALRQLVIFFFRFNIQPVGQQRRGAGNVALNEFGVGGIDNAVARSIDDDMLHKGDFHAGKGVHQRDGALAVFVCQHSGRRLTGNDNAVRPALQRLQDGLAHVQGGVPFRGVVQRQCMEQLAGDVQTEHPAARDSGIGIKPTQKPGCHLPVVHRNALGIRKHVFKYGSAHMGQKFSGLGVHTVYLQQLFFCGGKQALQRAEMIQQLMRQRVYIAPRNDIEQQKFHQLMRLERFRAIGQNPLAHALAVAVVGVFHGANSFL